MKQRVFLFSILVFFATSWASAEDWPEWRGRGRAGIWSESGILSTFPAAGLKINWRTPIRNGYSGPAVAQGRVFVTDFARQQGNRGIERALCLEERTGKILWTREWEADYIGLMETYATGPRATPTVDQDRVYVLGSKGKLLCLSVKTGSVPVGKGLSKGLPDGSTCLGNDRCTIGRGRPANLPGWRTIQRQGGGL